MKHTLKYIVVIFLFPIAPVLFAADLQQPSVGNNATTSQHGVAVPMNNLRRQTHRTTPIWSSGNNSSHNINPYSSYSTGGGLYLQSGSRLNGGSSGGSSGGGTGVGIGGSGSSRGATQHISGVTAGSSFQSHGIFGSNGNGSSDATMRRIAPPPPPDDGGDEETQLPIGSGAGIILTLAALYAYRKKK